MRRFDVVPKRVIENFIASFYGSLIYPCAIVILMKNDENDLRSGQGSCSEVPHE